MVSELGPVGGEWDSWVLKCLYGVIFYTVVSYKCLYVEPYSTQPFLCVVANAEAFFQGDILMSKEQHLALKTSGTDTLTLPLRVTTGRAVNGNNQAKWPAANGLVKVPYVIEHSSGK